MEHRSRDNLNMHARSNRRGMKQGIGAKRGMGYSSLQNESLWLTDATRARRQMQVSILKRRDKVDIRDSVALFLQATVG